MGRGGTTLAETEPAVTMVTTALRDIGDTRRWGQAQLERERASTELEVDMNTTCAWTLVVITRKHELVRAGAAALRPCVPASRLHPPVAGGAAGRRAWPRGMRRPPTLIPPVDEVIDSRPGHHREVI